MFFISWSNSFSYSFASFQNVLRLVKNFLVNSTFVQTPSLIVIWKQHFSQAEMMFFCEKTCWIAHLILHSFPVNTILFLGEGVCWYLIFATLNIVTLYVCVMWLLCGGNGIRINGSIFTNSYKYSLFKNVRFIINIIIFVIKFYINGRYQICL